MPDQILWATSVLGLCLWHEADKEGPEGYRCVAKISEDLALEFAPILNEIGATNGWSAKVFIERGMVVPTRESVENAFAHSLVNYPLEPTEAHEMTSGRKLSDFPWAADQIIPRVVSTESMRSGFEKLKPVQATKELLRKLDDLARRCKHYDQVRQTGLKHYDPNYPPVGPRGHESLVGAVQLIHSQIGYMKGEIMELLQVKPFLASDLRPGDRELLTVPDTEDETEVQPVEDMSGKTVTFEGVYSRDEPSADSDEVEDHLESAVKLAVKHGQISTAVLQRQLNIGFTLAKGLIDKMEELEIIGHRDGPRPRKTLITEEQIFEYLGEEVDSPTTWTGTMSVNGKEVGAFSSLDPEATEETLKKAAAELAGSLHGVDPEDAIPSEVDVKVPMSGKALKVILTAAAAKPGKNDPALSIHSVGVGKHSICATDQKKAVIVGEVEESYESTDRTEALVEASSADLRGEWVAFSNIERMKAIAEGQAPPAYPQIGKVVNQLEGMVEVGTFSPSLLKQVAMVAESLGTNKVTLFRASGSGVDSMLGFKGEYWPFEQLELFSPIKEAVPFMGILAGTEKRRGAESSDEGSDDE